MKKTTYILCVCLLCIMAFMEIKHNIVRNNSESEHISKEKSETGSDNYVATAHFASQVKKENEQHTGKKKTAYLTFDDGPSSNTGRILDILDEYDVKATFFVVGKEDERYRPLYNRIVDEGHTLAMHSYSHKYQEIYQSKESYVEDLTKLLDSECMVDE